MKYSTFTQDDEKEFLKLSEGTNAVACFIYSTKVLKGGKVSRYDENNSRKRTVVVGKEIFAPAELFTVYFSASAEITDKTVTLSLGERTAKVTLADDGADCAIERDGALFLPVKQVAEALGLSYGRFFDGRFVVVGDADVIEMLKNNSSLADAGAYAVFGEYEADSFTAEDYKKAKDKWRMKLVGSPELNDLSDPDIAAKVKTVSDDCTKALERLNQGDKPIVLFGDSAPTESVDLGRQYHPIVKMAKAYATYGSQYYHDESLLKKIIFCMDWMYENMYGEAEIAGTGWRDVHLFNWWNWFVEATECITDIIFIIEDHLTYEDKKRYLKLFEWIATFMRTGPGGAMSRVCVCTKTGLCLEDPKYLKQEYFDFNQLLSLHKDGIEGPHVDYLCFTHGFPHNTSYGVLHLDRVLLVSSILSGTPVEYSSPEQYNQFMFAKYMFEPSMYNGLGFLMLTGRSVTIAEIGRGASIIRNILPMIGVFGEEEDKYLKKFIKRSSVFEKMRKTVIDSCSIYDLSVYKSILNDDTIPYTNDYEYAHAWYTGDRVVQHRNEYAVAVATSSLREMAYESINSCNKTGWYTGDGAMYLYTNYDNAQYDGNNFIAKNINIAYRYPGTTEDMQPRVARSILNNHAWRNPTLFSGGMSFKEKYITCGFDFTAMFFDGPDMNIEDRGYGGGLAVHHNDLVAKKSWFMFDDEIICLGAGITSTQGSPVNTVAEHRRVVKDEEFSQLVATECGTEILEKSPFEKHITDAKWVLMEGHAGYLLLDDSNIYIGRYNCEECEGQPFFELRIEHGENPCNASYAYAVIPYATEEKLNGYYKDPDVKILSNTSKVAAVRENNIGVTGYVFYEPTECCGIAVNEQCMITTGETDGIFEFSVCDPTQELKEIKILVNKKLTLLDRDKEITVAQNGDSTEITVNCDGSCGKPYNVKFAI